MRVEPELPDHPKYLRLKRRVGDFAMEALVRLWGHCQQNQRGGCWRGVDAEYVELIAKWDGEPVLLFRSLLETGWIEQKDDTILIHDWDEMNKQFVTNWNNGTKGGRPKKNAIPEETNQTETQRLTQSKTDTQLGLVAISGSQPNNPLVNPIPVSGNPLETQREPSPLNLTKPNLTQRNQTEGGLRYDFAEQVIHFLNEQTNAEFKGTTSELYAAALCLAKVGNDVEGVKKMVARQVVLWKPTPKMAACLQPRTLFDEEKFDGYYAMRDLPTDVASDPADRKKELADLIQKHPANRESIYHRSDVTPEEKEELRRWRQELSELGRKIAASSNA